MKRALRCGAATRVCAGALCNTGRDYPLLHAHEQAQTAAQAEVQTEAEGEAEGSGEREGGAAPGGTAVTAAGGVGVVEAGVTAVVLWPVFHPNFGHFALDVMPSLLQVGYAEVK